MREFKTGAVRDTNKGKISYFGFRHPLCENSFGKYMLKNQKQADGNIRKPNNWWGTWDEEISIDSLVRHAEDLQAIEAGSFVYKIRIGDEEETVIKEKILKKLPNNWTLVTKEDCYNAIRFNSMAGLLKYLKTNSSL